MDAAAFGRQLRGLREAAGLSQDALAALVGVSKTTIQNWEAGLAVPRSDYIATVSAVLEVDADELLKHLGGPRGLSPEALAQLAALVAEVRRRGRRANRPANSGTAS